MARRFGRTGAVAALVCAVWIGSASRTTAADFGSLLAIRHQSLDGRHGLSARMGDRSRPFERDGASSPRMLRSVRTPRLVHALEAFAATHSW